MGGSGGGFKAPTMPSVPATPASVPESPAESTTSKAEQEAAALKQRRLAAAMAGRQSTILTSGLGATGEAPTTKKQALGA